MPNITIEMTEAQLFALDVIAKDKQEWADNVLTNRARIAIENMKSSEAWVQAITALAQDGGDTSDDEAILLKGRDLGLIKTAQEVVDLQENTQVPVTLDTNPLEIPLTKRQINAALIQGAEVTEPDEFIRNALASISDPKARALAINDWDYKPTHERSSTYFNDPDMMEETGMTKEQIDGLWMIGVKLPA